MALQHFLLGKEYLGNRLVSDYRDDPGIGYRVAPSFILVCSKCQDVWARVIHDHPSIPFTQVVQRRCPLHIEYAGDGFISSPEYRYPEALKLETDWPRKAIVHDFQVALNHPHLGMFHQ